MLSRLIPFLLSVLLCVVLFGTRAEAGTFTTTVQSNALSTDDSYVSQENVTEDNGLKSELRIKASGGTKNRNLLAKLPLPSLAGKTVLQASLKLVMFGASSSTPISARVYPLTQTWNELDVSWRDRTLGSTWSTPGGTAGAYWSDRVLLSEEDNGTRVSWQVGPIVNAWLLGDLANCGFVIKPEGTGSDREVTFRSSEYTSVATNTPQLTITYTDEPPALRNGFAEIQPTAVRAGATNTPLTLWLDVNSSGSTPSGNATGFDLISVLHGGALSVTSIDRILVGGVAIDPSQISWYDTGTSVTVQLPTVRSQARVQIDIGATVLSDATMNPLEMPILVDNTLTPGAGGQFLWPGNADGVSGNGDSWSLSVTSLSPIRIDLMPDSLAVVNRTCSGLQLYGQDNLGNQFTLDADSFKVTPASLGTVSRSAVFCAAQAGIGKIIAYYAALRDTTRLTVTPALTPVVSSLTLRDARGLATTTLSPADTMFFDVTLGDGNGFKDITGLDVAFHYEGHANDTSAPAYRAAYRFTRGSSPPWSLVDPVPSTWALLSALSVVDTVSNATSAQTARLAFKPGRIARASGTGQWTAEVRVYSATPLDTTTSTKGALDARVRMQVASGDTAAAFNPGRVDATFLPLRIPTSAKLTLALTGNTSFNLNGAASDLVGVSSPADTMRVGSPTRRIRWSYSPSTSGSALLDTAWTSIEASSAAPVSETAVTRDLYLWIDHPASAPAQDYRGRLSLALEPNSVAGMPATMTLPLTATVVGAGQAADSALAEVLPHSVQAGGVQTMTAYLLPVFQSGDTGLDRIQVNIPAGYSAPAVSSVRVDGLPAAFTDLSQPGLADVLLATPVQSSVLVEVRLTVTAPTVVSAGSDFVILYDDAGTPLPPQSASQGDANGLADGNNWHVTVVPGPVASLTVTPSAVACFLDTTIVFSATGTDAYGNSVAPVCSWSVQGGIGTIGASDGRFTPTAAGRGIVIGTSDGIADTASVNVRPDRGISISRVDGPTSLYQGQEGARYGVRLENLGADSVLVDSVSVRFTRAAPGDADGDFTVSVVPGNPVGIGGAGSSWFFFDVGARSTAATGNVTVGGRAYVTEVASGTRYSDLDADTSETVIVTLGGFDLSAAQASGTVSPGAADVLLLTLTVTSHYPDSRTLHGLSLTNRTSGAGNQEQLGAELGELTLVRDNGDGVLEPGVDTPLLQTVALDGSINFTPLTASITPGASATFFVTANLPLEMRDGDALDLTITGPAAISFSPPSFTRNAWPVDPPGFKSVNGMVAAQVTAVPVGPASVLAGSVRQPALDVTIPANGYEEDQMVRLSVINVGTADPASDIAQVEGWVDDGDGAFNPSTDALLGTLFFTGDRWQRTGLSEPVPLAGLRVFFTVDVAELAVEGRTVQLAIPDAPAEGIGMQSGNSGPLDDRIDNANALPISTANRVSVTSGPIPPAVVRPGARGIPLLDLLLSNRYADKRILSQVTVTNATVGPGPTASLDREVQALTLHEDGNANGVLDDPSVDPTLGTGFFSGGQAVFSGLQLSLLGGESRRLFVTADVSRADAADGDVISAVVAGPGDVQFAEPTLVTGAWPVTSGAHAAIDGLSADQIASLYAAASSLGPGEGPALALDVIIPRNGYLDDELNSIRLVNLGTAGPNDIAALRLWRDGGDGLFSAGVGDDIDLGVLTRVAGEWVSGPLSEPLTGTGARLFVAITASVTPADSSTVQFSIPVGGIENASGNDGPLDGAVASAQIVTISTSPLLASIDTETRSSTVGQEVRVRMLVRNAGAERVTGIAPSAVALSGPANFALVSGPSPGSFDLSPAERDTFVWVYASGSSGEAQFSGSASGIAESSGIARRAVQATSSVHRVFDSVPVAHVEPVQSMPSTVGRGQVDVVPFSLTFTNPGGPGASGVRLRAIRIRLEDPAGGGIVPSQLLSRVQVAEGTNVYLTKTALESAGADVALTLATPVLVTPDEPTTLSLRLDISASAVAPGFRVVLADSFSLTAEDATSGAPVTIRRQSGLYPIVSGTARLVAEATELDLAGRPSPERHVVRGSTDVSSLALRATNAGISGVTSDIRLEAFGLTVCDTTGAPVPQPSRYLKRIRVRAQSQEVAAHVLLPSDPADLTLLLNPRPLVPVASPLDIEILCDIADSAQWGAYRLRVGSPALVNARDANTNEPVLVVLEQDPIEGSTVFVESAAESVAVSSAPLFPSNARVGDVGVRAIRVVLRHPGGPGTAHIRLDSLSIACRDEARRALAPSTYLDRLRIDWEGQAVADIVGLPGGAAPVAVPLAGPLLGPGDSAVVEVVVDLRVSAPSSFLELAIQSSGVLAEDANTGLPLRVLAEPGAEFPLLSGLTHLEPPPRELIVAFESLIPAALAPDGREVPVARLTLTNPAGSGSIQLDHLVLVAADAGQGEIPLGRGFTGAVAWVGGMPWATSAALTADSVSAYLGADSALVVGPGASIEVEVRLTTVAPSVSGSFRIGLEQTGVGVIQPSSALLAVLVRAQTGQAFPFWTQTGTFAPLNLKDSYSNFPNPFAAGREETSFAFYLPRDARVTLRIWTPAGERVATVAEGAARAAGVVQLDRWTGRNGTGRIVRNGVYVAELIADYADGTSERVLRKVGVVR